MRPEPSESPLFYQKYLDLVPSGDILDVLREGSAVTTGLLDGLREGQAQYAYAPGKWTLKQMLGHMADVERVFAYRMLRAAREDVQTPLAGFSDDDWAAAHQVHDIPVAELAQELQVVRAATLMLLRHLAPDDWTRPANVNGTPMTVRAMAYIIAGHERHHQNLMREKYLNRK